MPAPQTSQRTRLNHAHSSFSILVFSFFRFVCNLLFFFFRLRRVDEDVEELLLLLQILLLLLRLLDDVDVEYPAASSWVAKVFASCLW